VELRRYLYLFRRHAALIVATIVVAVAVGWVVTPRGHFYRAVSTLYVGPPAILGTPNSIQQGVDPFTLANEISLTYSVMIQSREVIQAALTRTGTAQTVDHVAGELSAAPQIGTQLIHIAVTDANAHTAAALSNAIAQAFLEKVRTLNPVTQSTTAPGLVPSFPVYLFETAIVPPHAVPTALKRHVELAALLGVLAGAGLALLVEYLDLTVRGESDVQRRLALPVLGVIPLERDTT
jgi:capsular polysaccharide biosynthesis protein